MASNRAIVRTGKKGENEQKKKEKQREREREGNTSTTSNLFNRLTLNINIMEYL